MELSRERSNIGTSLSMTDNTEIGLERQTVRKQLALPKRTSSDMSDCTCDTSEIHTNPKDQSQVPEKKRTKRSRVSAPAATTSSPHLNIPATTNPDVVEIVDSPALPKTRKSGRKKTKPPASTATTQGKVVDLTQNKTGSSTPDVTDVQQTLSTSENDITLQNLGSTCGYCLQEVDVMIDPRAMPCGHFFCRPCLEADNRDMDVIKCCICKWNFESTDVLKLPKVPQYPSKAGPPNSQPAVMCDICDKGDKHTAVRFCMVCHKKMCDTHTQFHDDYQKKFSSSSHNTISIKEYTDDFSNHSSGNRTCPKHHNTYTLSCSNCMQLFCEKCEDTDTNCSCEDASNTKDIFKPMVTPHRLSQLKKLSVTLVKKLQDHTVRLSQKESDVARLDKTAWSKYDKLETHVQQMINTVDETVQKKVNKITKLGADLKQTICDYQLSNAGTVEKYSEDINERLDSLASLRSDIHQISKSNDVEIISKYTATVDRSSVLLKDCPSPLILKRKALNSTVEQKPLFSLGIGLVTPKPKSIVLHSKSKSAGAHYYTVKLTNNGMLVGKNAGGFEVRTEEGRLKSSHRVHGFRSDIYGLGELADDHLVALERDSQGSDYTITRYTTEGEYENIFALFEGKKSQHSMMAVSTNRIVITMSVSQMTPMLYVFDHQGNKISAHKLDGMKQAYGVTFLMDGCLAVCDRASDMVIKYTVEPKFKKLWTYHTSGIQPSSIAADEHGFIYVPDLYGTRIDVLDNEKGEKVCELTSSLIQLETLNDIDVRDDKLVLACGTGGVKVFEINR